MTLDEALQLIKTKKTDEFMAAARPLASAVLAEKPWKHSPTYGDAHDCYLEGPCSHCGQTLHDGRAQNDDITHGCPVPPPLEGSPADIAFALRDIVKKQTSVFEDYRSWIRYFGRMYEVIDRIIPAAMHRRHLDPGFWWMYTSPYEQIAVCLEALGQWEAKP